MSSEQTIASMRWEQYIETIDDIQKVKGYAKVKDVAQALDLGLPTVTEMFQKLGTAGLINYEKYSGVTLTEEGQAMADSLAEKHETLKEFLTILGVPDDVADGDACVMEHNVSTETLDRLTSFIRFVSLPEDGPIWLLHFREYYDTGSAPNCTRDCMRSCVDGEPDLKERLRRQGLGSGE